MSQCRKCGRRYVGAFRSCICREFRVQTGAGEYRVWALSATDAAKRVATRLDIAHERRRYLVRQKGSRKVAKVDAQLVQAPVWRVHEYDPASEAAGGERWASETA